MRFIFILLFSLIFSALVLGTEHYLDIFDNVDVDAIINNDRILNQYMNCILDKGPCNVDGRTLKCKYMYNFYFISIYYDNI